jgi:hypothetical protein
VTLLTEHILEKAGELAHTLEKVLQSDERKRMSGHDKWDLVVQ